MKKALALSICMLVPMLLVACGDSGGGTGPSPPPEGYYPMQVGSIWHYVLTGTESDDVGDWIVTGEETWNVTGDPTHDQGFKVFAVEIAWEKTYTPVGGGTSYTMNDTYTDYVYVDDDVVRWYDLLSSTSYFVDLELPLAVGNRWDYWPDFPGYANIEVMSLSASVDVPAGNFVDCAHLSFDYGQAPDDYLNRYYAEGTGLVSQIQHEDNGVTDVFTYEFELTSYSQ